MSKPKVEWRSIPFGDNIDGERLDLSICSDGRVQLGERRGPEIVSKGGGMKARRVPNQVGMQRNEVLELIRLLNKNFVLDVLGDV